MGMIAAAVGLFAAARFIEIETVLDKIMVTLMYVFAALCLVVAVIMCIPVGRRIAPMIDEARERERKAAMAKFEAGPWRFTLRKAVVGQLPVLVVFGVLYAAGEFGSPSGLLLGWGGVVLLYFVITYFYYRRLAKLAARRLKR